MSPRLFLIYIFSLPTFHASTCFHFHHFWRELVWSMRNSDLYQYEKSRRCWNSTDLKHPRLNRVTRKKSFCYGNKIRDNTIGQQIFFLVAATKNFAAATKRFVDRTEHFVVVKKYFFYPYLKKWFCWYNKIFYSVYCLFHFPMTRSFEIRWDLRQIPD